MHIQSHHIILLFMLFAGLFTSCEQSIYVKPTDVSDKVNIYSISNSADAIEVFVYKQKNLAGYIEQTDKVEFIKNATVEVEDVTSGEKETLTLASRWEKDYQSYPWLEGRDSIFITYYKSSKPLTINHTYRLTVKNGDRTYTSQATTPQKTTVNSVDTLPSKIESWQIKQDIKVRYQINDLTLYYEPFQVSKFMYITYNNGVNDTSYYDQINKLNLQEEDILGEKSTTFTNFYNSNDINQPKDTLTQKVAVNVYSEGAGKYLLSTYNQSNTIGNNFSEPSFLKSNIEGKNVSGVFGFFSTSDTVYQKVLGYW